MKTRRFTWTGALLLVCATSTLKADTFGSGANAFEIPFVTIGSPGNLEDTVVARPTSDPLPSGAVDYTYRMARYEISEEIVAKANLVSSAAGEPLDLQVDVVRGPDKPATGLSWFDAARIVNWLNVERGTPPAYKFDDQNQFQLWGPGDPGYNPSNPFRNTRARYVLPSADEWHKAAYYDPIGSRFWLYPYGSDDPPIAVTSGTTPGTAVFNQDGPADVKLAGGESPFGIVGMAGNVIEFEETNASLDNSQVAARRGARGGWWSPLELGNFASSFRNSALPFARPSVAGIRVASVPEPGAQLLTLIGGSIALKITRHQEEFS